MHIWTDNPLEAIWNQLRYLTKPANVKNILVGKIKSGRNSLLSNSEQLENQADEIASCISQADEYFQASRVVGLATKPLLQFYGAQALSKAVILANDPSIKLAQFKFHGLSTHLTSVKNELANSLQKYEDSPSSWQLELEYAITKNGVFPHLARVANDFVPPQGNVLHLKELFRIIPDMADLYRRHYNEPSHCLYLYEDPKLENDGNFSIFFSSDTKEDILKVFPEFSNGYESVMKSGCTGFKSITPLSKEPSFGIVSKGTLTGSFYVRPHSSGIMTKSR